MTKVVTLGDLGERRILREIIPEYVSGAGDDCADIGAVVGHVVVTTDPVPTPAAKVIGNDDDPYWIGWLLVTINASDVAAAGAAPLAFLAAIEMPDTLPVADFRRLLQGIRDSCEANGLRYVGGNIREAARISGTGTAIGSSTRSPLTRTGAAAGDYVVVLGDGGRFWADVERIDQGIPIDKATSPVFAPVSQARIVYRLHEAGLLKSAMDTSDGLAPTLEEMARLNSLTVRIDLNSMSGEFSDVHSRPERLWFGWGDWTVVAVAAPEHAKSIEILVSGLGGRSTAIGRFKDGPGEVLLEAAGVQLPLGRLESERFASDSWFSNGIGEYRRLLRELRLP